MVREARRYIGRRVMVETSKGSLSGRLLDASRRVLVLNDAELHPESGRALAMAGEVVVPAVRVDWLQVADR